MEEKDIRTYLILADARFRYDIYVCRLFIFILSLSTDKEF